MRILGWLLGGVLALVLMLAGIGMVLPASFSIERSIEIRAPAERVHALVASPRQWTRWSAWNARDPDMQIRYSGPESGVGAAWAWRSASEGNGEMEFVAAEPGRGIDYVLRFPDYGMESRGVLRIDAAGEGVRLTWTNAGELGGNPLNRWFGLFMDGLVGPDFESGLARLKALAEDG